MKTKLLALFIFAITINLLAQNQQFQSLHPDSVLRQNPLMSKFDYEPGEIIIRFEDDLIVKTDKESSKLYTSNIELNKILESTNILEIEQLFPFATKREVKEYITTFTGKKIEIPNLHNIYRLTFSLDPYEQNQIIEELRNSKGVIYAEPNYIQTITDCKPLSPIMSESEMREWDNPMKEKSINRNSFFTPNDPLYPDQWYIPAVGADLVWDSIDGKDSTQVIAILDTGVDWGHPDLQNKIWMNEGEIPDNGIDDDGNGKVDDVRGWDWINHDNNPMDDNSHGTHVAGIAAAEANNGIGISGVSHGAKIMPLKVFQSSGRGNSSDITQAIIYATQQNATVINMSFGTYARSYLMEDALVNAYATTILVAAAGNDNIYIGPELICNGKYDTFFPAAFSFVLGVQDDAICGLGFSNFDYDPVQSNFYELFNYEIKAPGYNILSLVPNGGYRIYQGTSMATPIVSAIGAIYQSTKQIDSQELMWGNFIYTSDPYININEAINASPVPKLMIINQTLVDTLEGDDNDGKVDAGELIEFWISARNTWGQCDSAIVMMKFDEYEDTTLASFIENNQLIGSTSPYSLNSNEENPIKIQFAENIAHNRDIRFIASLYYPNSPDTITKSIIISVSNGTELSGILTQNTILTPDRFWLIENSLRIGTGVDLTVLPGTNLEVNAIVDNRGTANFIGNSDSLIQLKGYIGGNSNYSYVNIDANYKGFETNNQISNCTIRNLYSHIFNYYPFKFQAASNCIFEDAYFHYNRFFSEWNQVLSNCIIRNSYITNFTDGRNPSIESSIFYKIQMSSTANYQLYTSFESGSFQKNIFSDIANISTIGGQTILFRASTESTKNSFLGSNDQIYFVQSQGIDDYQNFPDNYWGSDNEYKIKAKYYDFWNDATLPFLMIEPRLDAPSDSCHAHVWKVLVNGADAQDEYVEPVGVGPQRFDVFFNRDMDTTYTPQVTFGVRYPYTQQIASDLARWDSTHRIFTVYKNIQLYTGDGINRIRIAKARDMEGWEIPVEDMRFEFLINAAGSASIDFTATPGIGKVELEWHEPDDLPTLLGYNMYRFHHITDTTFSDTTLVNSSLINDTLFTDFNVDPLEKYYYMYKIVRTDFTESDYSKVVNAIVLTASAGDANGDQAVNVQDIISIVGFILNQNPQPFLSEAADVNEDGNINLLDIIAVVNIIMGGGKQPQFSSPAYAYLEPEQIRFKSDGTLSGFQFQLISPDIENLELRNLLPEFEFIKFIKGDTLTGLVFSLDNKVIPEGKINLFEITHHPGNLQWGELFAGNTSGVYVPVYKDATQLPEDFRYNFTIYPNPSNGNISLDIFLPENSDIEIQIFNSIGQIVYGRVVKDFAKGNHQLLINLSDQSSKGLHYVKIHYQAARENPIMHYVKSKKILIL